MQGHRFAYTRSAKDGDRFARLDDEADVIQHDLRAESLADMLEFDIWLSWFAHGTLNVQGTGLSSS
jgi:hypothetical protein